MEGYRGSLARLRMHLLMPALFSPEPRSGIVRTQRGSLMREFLIHRGFLVAQSSNRPREHLGQVLVALGLLNIRQAADAFAGAVKEGRALGQFLVEHGIVDRSRLEAALETKAKEAFVDCYRWEVGELEFIPCQVPRVGLSLEMHLPLLHHEAMGRLAEWRAFEHVFPERGGALRVDASRLGLEAERSDLTLLALAQAGVPLSELVQALPEGPGAATRRLLSLQRKGALLPVASRTSPSESAVPLAALLERARTALSSGHYEEAMGLAETALDRGPVDEAHALYQEAELRLTRALYDEVLNLEGQVSLCAVPEPLPSDLTVDDLYLYGRLRASRSLQEALRGAAMGEHAAVQAMRRLVKNGLVGVERDPRLRRTARYGLS